METSNHGKARINPVGAWLAGVVLITISLTFPAFAARWAG
jgi:hypothetical protein